MKTYRNSHWHKRDYECTNVVAARSEGRDPRGYGWTLADDSAIFGLTLLWIEAGVEYWGYL